MTAAAEQIKERLNIVDVVAQYVKLTKAGKDYKGLSPFKKEKTPSFHVSPDKGMYYDFSSNQGGDIFTFVQAMEGVDFKGALRILADKAGIELKAEPRDARDARERSYAALEEATQWYETMLSQNTEAREYLLNRGLTPATMRTFRLGYAPDSWSLLRDHLLAKKYSNTELEAVGLIKRGDKGTYYDRFRSRVMFPMFDTAGRTIAFSGRIIGTAAEDKENAKYLNSPETAYFQKGRVLYGYHKAKQAIRTNDFSIVVEGQMDLVLCHQAGYANTVAVSGTAFTEDHASLLDRLSMNVCCAFDADQAGIASVLRVATIVLPRGVDMKVVRIAHGKDPADCIREDVSSWKKAVREAQHVVPFYLAHLTQTHAGADIRTIGLRARDAVLPLISLIASAVDRAQFVRVFAETLSIDEESVWEEVRALIRKNARTVQQGSSSPPSALEPHQAKRMTQRDQLEQSLAALLYYMDSLPVKPISSEQISELCVSFGVSLSGIVARYNAERELLSLKTGFSYDETVDFYELFREQLRMYAHELLREERARLLVELKTAERESRHEDLASLLARFKALADAITEIEKVR